MIEKFNLVLTGVGGQGVLTLSRIIALSALSMGYKVRVGETLGMSQRGGIVQSYIKFGTKVSSPLIEIKSADALISLDYIEALRAIKFIFKKTKVIVNSNTIPPISTLLGIEKLPSLLEVKSILSRASDEIYFIDANKLAIKAGLIASINIVMLGAFSAIFKDLFDRKVIMNSIAKIIPKRFLDANLKAFEYGFNFIENSKSSILKMH